MSTEPTDTPTPRPTPSWRHLWQLPLAATGIAIAIGAAVYAARNTPREDRGDGLVEASAQIDSGEYEAALGTLNAKVLPWLSKAALTKDQQRRFHLLRARAIFMGQRELGINREENHRNILAEYKEAESRAANLTSQDKVFICHTLTSLGEFDKALEEMLRLPEEQAEERLAIHKRLIDAALSGGPARAEAALDLITTFTQEPRLSDEERLWGLGRQAKMLMAAGRPEEAVTRILRAMPRLENSTSPAVGEVVATLGEAYLVLDQVQRAGAQLERAAEMLGVSHELSPKVARMLAQIDHAIGGESLNRARERYLTVLENWPNSAEVPGTLLGLAEVESALANTQSNALMTDSLEHYDMLVTVLRGGKVELRPAAADETPSPDAAPKPDGHAAGEPSHGPGHEAGLNEAAASAHAGGASTSDARPADPAFVQQALRSLMARFNEQFDKKDYHSALQFAALGERLVGVEQAPGELLLGLARTHRELASDLLIRAGGGDNALTLAQVEPATQREARLHLTKGAEYFRLHASKSIQSDTQAYGDSLWAAADMFDRAGDLPGSAAAFRQFASDFPSDSRRPMARFRLADAYRASGDLEAAANVYRELIAGRTSSQASSPVADASHVPLARTLLADLNPANDGEAEQQLLRVVRGEVGGTATPMFREALRTLGEHYYDTAQFERAIERLGEFVERSRIDQAEHPAALPQANGSGSVARSGDAAVSHAQDDGETLGIYFKLADAHRQSAIRIGDGFGVAMPDSQRRELEKARRDRLERAMALFDSVEKAYERMPERTGLDDLRQRNATFFKADCAYDLGDYDTAIRFYDAAKERYPRDAASLVAMVQIVGALLEQGKMQEAAVANVRAKKFYESLPDAAWEDPTLPMSRRQWEQWLEAQTRLAGVPEGGDATGE
jgi:tetratricopeptide (TPR) repeat protein